MLGFVMSTPLNPLPVFLLVSIVSVLFTPCRAPPSKYDCNLDSRSPFSFVVQIWDEQKKYKGPFVKPGRATFGALLTHQAVLVSAWYYVDVIKSNRKTNFTRFQVIGQNIWFLKDEIGHDNPCYQMRNVADIQVHPKAEVKGDRLYFDVGVIVLDSIYHVNSPSFPSILFPTAPLELLLAIRFVNIAANHAICALPLPRANVGDKDWILNDRIDVTSIPFYSQCTKLICQQKEREARIHSAICQRKMYERLNATVLCMKPEWTKKLEIPDPSTLGMPDVLAGIPLVCDGSTLGLSTHTKLRNDFPDSKQDFFFVVTLLRVFPWLIEMIEEYGAADNAYIDHKKLRFVSYPAPTRLTTDNLGLDNFFRFSYDEFPLVPPHQRPKSLAPGIEWSTISKLLFIVVIPHLMNQFSNL